MSSYRVEKAARVIRQSVSDTLMTRLHDPRIQGLVTVTEVDVSPDMKQAVVYLSVIGVEEKARRLTMTAIRNAAGVIQSALGKDMTSRYVPHLQFEEDTRTSKTLETLRLIEQASKEWRQREADDDPDESEVDPDG